MAVYTILGAGCFGACICWGFFLLGVWEAAIETCYHWRRVQGGLACEIWKYMHDWRTRESLMSGVRATAVYSRMCMVWREHNDLLQYVTVAMCSPSCAEENCRSSGFFNLVILSMVNVFWAANTAEPVRVAKAIEEHYRCWEALINH